MMLGSFIAGLIPLSFASLIYWYKWITSHIAILFYKRKAKRFDLYELNDLNNAEKIGFLHPQQEIKLESPLPESHLTDAADEIFFYGVNSKSECLVIRISRGISNESEAWIYLQLADGRTYDLFTASPPQETFQNKTTRFTCGDLEVYYLAAMRRWRIFYSGLLRKKSKDGDDSEKMIFVQFCFLWKASSDVFDSTVDLNSQILATSLANTNWNSILPPLKKFFEAFDLYAQSGNIIGVVSIDESPNYEICLYGERMRHMGKKKHLKGGKFVHILGTVYESGLIIHVGEMSIANIAKNLCFGFVIQPDSQLKTIKRAEIIFEEHPTSSEKCSYTVGANFTSVAGKLYKLTGNVINESATFKSVQGWNGFCDFYHINFNVNEFSGNGFVLHGNITSPVAQVQPKPFPALPKDIPLVISIADEKSCFLEISGGKGASLGRLTKLSKENKMFSVPMGVILTTAAYSEFLTCEILSEIKCLEDVLYGKMEGDVKSVCERISKIISESKLPDKICQQIASQLEHIFGENFKQNQLKFAVRSSATGEDTDQLSAAGQMETFLGVRGLDEIFVAVKKCWASQFGFVAVEYKRSNGQILNSPMAVVIQEMIPSEIAGVLFTCHPVTGNPTYVSITANYGLGESVVSGSEEPDMITLKRQNDGNLVIDSIKIGAKQHRIVMKEDGGTLVEDLPEPKSVECCLGDEMAKRLGYLGLKIGKYYRCRQDIEWGIRENKIYILQSRPVTTGRAETEFELKHEFDGPLRCENEYYTFCNVAEVMPGAASPLGIDLLTKYFGLTFRFRSRLDWNEAIFSYKYFPVGILNFFNHMSMSLLDLIFQFGGEKESLFGQGIQIGILGRVVDDPDVAYAAKLRYGNERKRTLMSKLDLLKNLFFSSRNLAQQKKEVDVYRFPYEGYTCAKDVFHCITRANDCHIKAFLKHMTCTETSSAWNMFMFATLAKAKNGFDKDVYSDFARLLATCTNVESADIPAAIQSLAFSITEHFGSEEFKALTPEDAQKLLETSPSSSGVKFRAFLKRHGHRCLKEFDIHSLTWDMNVKALVQLLQSLVGNCDKPVAKSETNLNEVLAHLKVPLDFISRCQLKFLLPRCRTGVRSREITKSMMIKMMDSWRKGYHYLAKLMVLEGYIPDADLMFFFTLDEISELLKTRSPSLIAKANRRRRLFPEMDQYMFPEISKGVPQPINTDEPVDTSEADFTMEGIPVSQGVARGYARVALSLEEAASLKPGEILITYTTDIGWSPYFPILAGVVTELGGLISHGAVVSREYGLPCVVGLHGATKRFCTGDYVLLDGNNGILKRLSKHDDNGVGSAK